MSRFTEIIILAKDAEDVMLPLTTDSFAAQWSGHRFIPIDDGIFSEIPSAEPACYMWIIQFGRNNWQGLFEYIEGLPWPDPYSVQLLLRDEDDDCFGLWMIFDGKLKEVPLPATKRTASDRHITGYMLRTDKPRTNWRDAAGPS
ncbi:hypothetical protein ACIRL2_49570 [Embleya sp. NPDC127516]|uniref:hypothetical protein n=1 Tax=Embleya sp. NPDC127516 TaxID=3363990 RepID=UPI00382854F4